MSRRIVYALVALLTLVAGLASLLAGQSALAQAPNRYFPETGHYVKGIFLQYWNEHGGLEQQGYPLTEEFQEPSLLDSGKTYTVQYFERAVFEHHPEFAGTPYEVLLTQLGTYEMKNRYLAGAPASTANPTNQRVFPETGFALGGTFRNYWEQHGDLAQQGLPLTNEFQEQNKLNGQTYMVQYFERAVFEYHPEFAGTPHEVLLTQVGKYQHDRRYPGNSNPAAAWQPAPTAVPPTATPVPPTLTPCVTCPATPTPAAGIGIPVQSAGWEVTITGARQVKRIEYQHSLDTFTWTAKEGFAIVVLDAKIRMLNTALRAELAGKDLRSIVPIVSSDGETFIADGGGPNSDDLCVCSVLVSKDQQEILYTWLNGNRAYFGYDSPGGDLLYDGGLVYALDEDVINKDFKLQFKDVSPIPFNVRK